MLCAKRKSDGQLVVANMEFKSNGPFICPDCNEVVILKSGRNKIDHFAHQNPLLCRFGASESETHLRCKTEIYKALLKEPTVSRAALERPLGTIRPDISFYVRNVPVGIEVQISSLSVEEIKYRTMEYFRKGIYVLWLLPWTPKLNAKRYNPSVWEKWIHTAYFGNVYYWLDGLSIVPYEFEPSFITVPARTWYSKNGERMTAGGYSKRSKRHRSPIRGDTLNLITDFMPKERDWWEGSDIVVPYAKLYLKCTQPNQTQKWFQN